VIPETPNLSIRAQDLAVGDILALNDWNVHVIGVERDRAVGILTAEFDFLIHFLPDEVLSIRAPLQAA
jgi:hypothetical protein